MRSSGQTHEVVSVPNAARARNHLAERDFDVALIDVRFNTDQGIDLVRSLANQPGVPALLVVTRNNDAMVERAALRAGADDYLENDELTARQLARLLRYVARHRRTQAVVRESEQRFRALIQHSVEGTVVFARDGLFTYVSPAVRRVLGYEDSELIGHHFMGFVHPDDATAATETFERCVRAPGIPTSACFRVRNRNGEWRWIDATAVNQLEESPVGGVVANFTDVTDREIARRDGQASENMFRAVFEEASDAVLIADDEGRYVAANRAAIELLGRAPDEILRLSVADVSPPGVDVAAAWRSFLAAGRQNGAYQLMRADGSMREVEFAAVARVLPGRHLSVLRDVTERTRVQAALRASETQAAALFNSGVVNIAFTDRSGCIKTANAAFLKTVGRSGGELDAGRITIESVTPPEFIAASFKAIEAALTGGHATPFRQQYWGPDGKRVWVLAAIVRVVASGVELAIVSIDISEHVELENALLESERRRAAIFATVPSGVYLSELHTGRIVDANDALCAMLVMSRDQVVGKTTIELGIWQDLRERERALHQLMDDQPVHNVPLVLGKGASARQVLISLHRLDVSGQVPLVISAVTDVTDRVQLEKQLQQAQKMEAVGRLAGGVAHDFNNLLTVIMGFTDFVLEGLGGDHALRGDIDEVRKAAQSAASLTKQLLAFSRRQILDPKVLDVSQVVRDTTSMLRRVIGEDVQMTIKADARLTAHVDRGQLEQILMNLAVNARDAMPSGGALIIETARIELDDHYVAAHPGTAAGSHVAITITDTGVGMTEDVRSRVFEPFFTTKPEGVGTGLGLATVYGIVKQSGGSIYVYSEVGVGTTFKVFLPLVGGEPSAAATPNASGPLGGHETILLVEDQDGVRRIARLVLERQGYTVLEAASGADAIKVAARHNGTIDLLVTDVVMPKMTGREVATALQNRIPGLLVLYMSGYSDETITTHGLLHPGVKLLHKPFTAASLLQQVRAVLGAER